MKPGSKFALQLLGAAMVGALLVPAESVDKLLVKPRKEQWNPLELPRRPELTGVGLAMVTSPLFEPEAQIAAAAAAAAAPPEDLRWRVAGLLRRDKEPSVLVNFLAQSKPAQVLRIGDKLPSGHTITRIDDNEICVQLGKKNYRLGVEYRAE